MVEVRLDKSLKFSSAAARPYKFAEIALGPLSESSSVLSAQNSSVSQGGAPSPSGASGARLVTRGDPPLRPPSIFMQSFSICLTFHNSSDRGSSSSSPCSLPLPAGLHRCCSPRRHALSGFALHRRPARCRCQRRCTAAAHRGRWDAVKGRCPRLAHALAA